MTAILQNLQADKKRIIFQVCAKHVHAKIMWAGYCYPLTPYILSPERCHWQGHSQRGGLEVQTPPEIFSSQCLSETWCSFWQKSSLPTSPSEKNFWLYGPGHWQLKRTGIEYFCLYELIISHVWHLKVHVVQQ